MSIHHLRESQRRERLALTRPRGFSEQYEASKNDLRSIMAQAAANTAALPLVTDDVSNNRSGDGDFENYSGPSGWRGRK